MQAKVPVVASDIPGNRDLIEHDKTGMLFPVADVGTLTKTTARLIESPELRQRLADNSHQKIIADFSLPRMIEQYEQLYERLWSANKGYG